MKMSIISDNYHVNTGCEDTTAGKQWRGGGVGDGKRSNTPLIKGQWMKADSQNCQWSNQQVTDSNG